MYGIGGKPELEYGHFDDSDQWASGVDRDFKFGAGRQGVRGVQGLAGDDGNQDGYGHGEHNGSAAGIRGKCADDGAVGQL